jgi:hypothetical protein
LTERRKAVDFAEIEQLVLGLLTFIFYFSFWLLLNCFVYASPLGGCFLGFVFGLVCFLGFVWLLL